ncbi:MAG: MASE3 domain-containing protein [Rhodoferax sp.]|nr:MASE3 domain-containing protein [Rhodoferax sp.]
MSEVLYADALPDAGLRNLLDRKSVPAARKELQRKLIFLALLALLALLSARVQTEFRFYLPLHLGSEFLSLVLVVFIFAVVWQTPAVEVARSHLLLATALFASGWFAFVHAFLFRGMTDATVSLSAAAGDAMLLAGRLIVALSLLGISFYPTLSPATRLARYGILAGYTGICLLTSTAVFIYGDSQSLLGSGGAQAMPFGSAWTGFIVALLALASWRSYQTAKGSDDKLTSTLFLAVAVTALAELMESQYRGSNDGHELLSHTFRLLALGLFYQALFAACVTRAYENLSDQMLMRRQSDQTLRTQAMALSSTVTPIVVTNLNGQLLWKNRASEEMMKKNFSATETGHSLFAPPFTADPTQIKEMRTKLEAGNIWQGRVRVRNQHGKEIVMDRTVTPVRDDQGQPHGYISVSEDVTEQEYAELRYKRVLEMSTDGFWIADAQGQLLEFNRAFVALSGYTVAELQTMHIGQLEDGSHARVVQRRIERIARLGKDRFEGRIRNKSGQEFVVDVTVIYDPEYKLFFGFVRDRTELVQAALNRKMLERQLHQSQKVEQLGQLTGGIAHDFNNSLATILGYSRLALERFVPDQQSKLANYLGEVVAASERARDLIAKMLTFAGTRPSLSEEVIKASVVVQQVADMMRVSIPAGIELKTWVEDDVAFRIDPGELSQVLVNLVINARDAIGEHGSIDLLVHRTEVDGEICGASHSVVSGSFAAVEVYDNGKGIAKEHLARLFDPFFTTKEVGKGTGLGLSMVQGILRRSNAYVLVKSEPGRGSSFKLLFPEESTAAMDSLNPEIKPSAPLASGRCIWVLDDEPSVARYLGELLGVWGYQARLFNHPSHVLTAFEIEHDDVDMVISDHSMPGMTGLALSKRLLEIKPELHVILCSGYNDACNFNEAQRQGVRRYLMKPINPKELREALAESFLTETSVTAKELQLRIV